MKKFYIQNRMQKLEVTEARYNEVSDDDPIWEKLPPVEVSDEPSEIRLGQTQDIVTKEDNSPEPVDGTKDETTETQTENSDNVSAEVPNFFHAESLTKAKLKAYALTFGVKLSEDDNKSVMMSKFKSHYESDK